MSEAAISTVLETEPLIRLSLFAGVFALLAVWEVLAPRRSQAIGRGWRWPNNLGVVVVDTLVLRVLFPTAAVGFTLVCEHHGWGALNNVSLPFWAKCLIAVIALDLVLYAQHVAFHAVPVLWRLHRMHHADLEFDVTTGVRFHPIEILLSMGLKLALVVVFGPPAVAVLVFEILLNGTSMFNHSNIRLPLGLDRTLRLSVVTP